jgi:hypothetical protein
MYGNPTGNIGLSLLQGCDTLVFFQLHLFEERTTVGETEQIRA